MTAPGFDPDARDETPDPLEEPVDADPDFDVEDPPLEPTDVSEGEALAFAQAAAEGTP